MGNGVYAVPIEGVDEDGCQRYRLWAADRMVIQAIHYRKADGSFSMNKNEAACMAAPKSR
ncbi:hypothetical protein JCM17844_14010 [Iodidimonas gelatinilytica]|uniref:Uncharacterized protein n=1 Tax=Iodidimonas gelatinilytica TaxID=1236966 RepID=A0A5A7MQ64_9PROT|nr:hypothetical protein [Iodidimonas gelatinilytica]GEQ97764.1 hypothetical protein JCM17844_14010 [Iodidimonas gelatinilytica]